MNQPLISIVIPTYRRPQSLKRSILSAARQTLRALKIIVCDNASNDTTREVVLKLQKEDARIHYIEQPQNIGMIANYSYGMSVVDTPYFSFLSDDDLLLPEFCEKALQQFKLYPEIAFAAGSTLIIDEHRRIVADPIRMWPREGLYQPPESFLEMIGKYPVPNTVLFHKQFVDSSLIDASIPSMWDCDFLLKIAAQYPIAIFKDPSCIFFHQPESFTYEVPFQSSIQALQKMIANIACNPHLSKMVKEKAVDALQHQMARDAYRWMLKSVLRNDGKLYSLCKGYLVQAKHNGKIRFLAINLIHRLLQTTPFLAIAPQGVQKLKRWLRPSLSEPIKAWVEKVGPLP